MRRTAKLFTNGRSQAVRLPADLRFAGSEVFVSRDAVTGDVILSSKPDDWSGFFQLVDQPGAVPSDFLADRDDAPPQERPVL